MKLGIISDIHSNIIAFRSCMEELIKRGCEEFIFLGDYVSDTAYTKETMSYLYEIMQQYRTYCIRGNREEYMLEQREVLLGKKEGQKWIQNSASGNLLYTYERLTERDLDFFEGLPITFRYEKEGYPAITFCHGSPINSRELMQFDGKNTLEWLEKVDTDYLIAAHTHHPGLLQKKNKIYMNTGSCGIAIGKSGLAECLILESVAEGGRVCWQPEFLEIAYDGQQVIRDLYSLGLHDYAPWFINANIHVLSTGIDRCAELVNHAKELSLQSEGEKGDWPYIKEKYFAQAAADLGIPDYKREMFMER